MEDTLLYRKSFKSFILGKLPEDFDYEGLDKKGSQTNFKACFVTHPKSHPGATVSHQLYEGDDTPLIIAIVIPSMIRVHK